jgi:ATP-dependent RNA helicase RhlE
MTSFLQLGLVEPLQRAVRDEGYTTPTPIQAQAIPQLLLGRDLLGCARTGTGKTAAFALPILQRLSASGARPGARSVRALVLAPTRELAAQVAQSFQTYGRGLHLSVSVVYGGVGQAPQVRALARGLDVLVATPGRLLDLIGQGHVRLDRAEVVVLDEADQMLDLGFLPDVRRIVGATPKQRQTLLFSATMPPPIAKLAEGLLRDPVKIFVTPVASTTESVAQRVHFVARAAKSAVLAKLLSASEVERALVFTRTKRGADRVARALTHDGIPASAIHGNKSQGQRERTLGGFRDGRTRVLVATDIAARGIDIDGITHVFNYELPNVPEVYVHRIGRTARAGASGVAVSLCDAEEREHLRDIERLTRRKLEVVATPHVEPAAHRARTEASRAHGQSPRSHGHAPRAQGHASGAKHGGAAPKSRPGSRRGPHRGRAAARPQPVHRPSAAAASRPAAPPGATFGAGLTG